MKLAIDPLNVEEGLICSWYRLASLTGVHENCRSASTDSLAGRHSCTTVKSFVDRQPGGGSADGGLVSSGAGHDRVNVLVADHGPATPETFLARTRQ